MKFAKFILTGIVLALIFVTILNAAGCLVVWTWTPFPAFVWRAAVVGGCFWGFLVWNEEPA